MSFNGTIVAEVTSSTSASVRADLLGAAFSVGATVGGTTYYRRSFNSNSIVKLYIWDSWEVKMKKFKEFCRTYHISISILISALIIGLFIMRASSYLGSILFMK